MRRRKENNDVRREVNHLSQVCEVVRAVCTDGERAGLRTITVSNGVLNVEFLENRALDLSRVFYKGISMGFVSKNGITARKEEGFHRSFPGGMLYTCGLDAIGAIEGHALHGNLHNIPATVVSARADETGATIEGEIRDSALFGQNLCFTRKIFIPADSGRIEISDVLKNEGYRDERYCLLYHINSGYPFLCDRTTIGYDEISIVPRTEWAETALSDVKKFQLPVDNEEERCYFIRLKTPRVRVTNPVLGKSLTIGYSADTLPCLVEWKSGASGDYALGIEPCTTFLDKPDFAYRTVKAGESVNFRVVLEFSDT